MYVGVIINYLVNIPYIVSYTCSWISYQCMANFFGLYN